MLFVSLMITAATSISGLSNISNAKNSERLQELSSSIVSIAPNVFDYSDYNLTSDESSSFCKQKLYSYAKDNSLISNEQSQYLKNQIENSSDYTVFQSLDDMYLKGSNVSQFKYYLTSLNETLIFSDVSSMSLSIKNTDIKPTFDQKNSDTVKTVSLSGDDLMTYDGGGGGGTSKTQLETNLPYTESNVAYATSGKLDNANFFGIICTPDMCISMYNKFAEWINNRCAYAAAGSKTPFEAMRDIIISFASSGVFTAIVIEKVVKQIVRYLTGFLDGFFGLFASLSPIAIALGIIISLIAAVSVYVFAKMLIYGYMRKGFAIGWKVYSLFNWSWYNGEVA